MSKVKVLADVVSPEASLLDFPMATILLHPCLLSFIPTYVLFSLVIFGQGPYQCPHLTQVLSLEACLQTICSIAISPKLEYFILEGSSLGCAKRR